ncbi:MAG: acylase, partial [Calditrichaeota bacterium]
VLRKWDLRTNPENTSAALAILTLQSLLHGREIERDPAQLVAGLIETARRLKERFGRVDVPWAQVNRLIRGQVDYGLGGGPDVLHAVYGKEMKDGRLRGFVGDSYVLLVTWDAQGRVHSRSIHQYGSATLDATSPHYADQAELFVRRQLKPVWLDVRDIRAHLEREYRPGEERPVPQ